MTLFQAVIVVVAARARSKEVETLGGVRVRVSRYKRKGAVKECKYAFSPPSDHLVHIHVRKARSWFSPRLLFTASHRANVYIQQHHRYTHIIEQIVLVKSIRICRLEYCAKKL